MLVRWVHAPVDTMRLYEVVLSTEEFYFVRDGDGLQRVLLLPVEECVQMVPAAGVR